VSEVEWFLARARRALPEQRADDLSTAFLVHLATVGIGGAPVENLAAWAKRCSLVHLRREIQSMQDSYIHGLAEAEAGMPKRRGDLIRVRSKLSWWDMRTK